MVLYETHKFTCFSMFYSSLLFWVGVDCNDLSFEGEHSGLVGELEVSSRESVELLLNVVAFLLLDIEHNLEHLSAVGRHLDSLASDLMRGDNVVEDGLVDGSQGAGSGSDLDTLASEVLVDHGSVGGENNVLLGELLLELSNQSSVDLGNNSPRLVREVNNDGLSASLDLDLLSSRDDDVLELGLEIAARADLDVEESLSNFELQITRRLATALNDL